MTSRFSTILGCALALLLAGSGVAAKSPKGPADHDLSEAKVMDRVILAVMEHYYDPLRLDPRKMFKAAMDAVQKSVAEVKVSYGEDDQYAVVEVVDQRLKVGLQKVNSPWALSRTVHRVFGFLGEQLPASEHDLLTLEYQAANGMLATLDPHSNALPPDLYEDLRMGTTGEFGGLGIKITTDHREPCNGDLTVVEVFEGTPAADAGFKPGDKILRIERESTVNITTSEAAERLRGKPGTKVRVQLKRADGSTKVLDITRRRIPIESVKWKLLEGKVGYIELQAFQSNSEVELQGALRALHKQGMKGLILDLRGNPGGLLDVAVAVADRFLNGGTIVATAGRNKDDQSVRNASVAGTEPSYPLVILVDSSSASAAEIIAGAMRNHGRALLVGETTFGKGSVQMVMPLPGEGALRLTSAQYLTPGDISIQAVGVAPDVRFNPANAERDELNLRRRTRRFSEADLEGHLDRPSVRERGDRPGSLETTLFVPPTERKSDRRMFERCYSDNPDRMPFRARHELEFARRLIAAADGVTAEELLQAAREIIAQDAAANERALARALKRLGVDWSAAPEGAAAGPESAEVEASVRLLGKVVPGQKLALKVTVKNNSKDTIYRLTGETESDNASLAGQELVFGKIEPGRSRNWTARIELPARSWPRKDPLTVKFRADSGPVPAPAAVDVAFPPQPEAKLAYAWHVEDLGNGNGFAEPGEELLMHVYVTNTGDGSTFPTEANLSAKPGVDVIQGRFHVGELRPGDDASGKFRLKIASRFPHSEAALKLAFEEWVPGRLPITRTLLEREVDLPVSPTRPGAGSASGEVTLIGEKTVQLREAPSGEARVVATAEPGASFPVVGRLADYFRVRLGPERHAWVRQAQTRPGGGGKPLARQRLLRPPRISISGERVRTTSAAELRLKGWAEHQDGIRDVMVFVGERKVAYVPNPGGQSGDRVEFNVAIPLEPGANRIFVIARHDDKVLGTETVFVRHTAP